ncbi:MAG: DnaD domain protein [Halobacteriota archaeon]|nr:DnaD domain protein [Halobacteriota archaeon]
MKWFEHSCDAHGNPTERKILRIYGMAGLGRYWTLQEIIGKDIGQAKDGKDGYLKNDYDWELLTEDLKFDTSEELKGFLQYLAEINAIDIEAWELGKIYCPKLLEVCDEYTKKLINKTPKGTVSRQYPDTVPTLSGKNPPRIDKIRLQNNTADADNTPPATTAFEIWQKCGGTLATAYEAEVINDWLNTYEESWIIDAITEAASNGHRKVNTKYVEAILERWQSEGRYTSAKPEKRRNADRVPERYPTVEEIQAEWDEEYRRVEEENKKRPGYDENWVPPWHKPAEVMEAIDDS